MQAISKADLGIDSLQVMDREGVLWRESLGSRPFSLRRMLARTMSLGTRPVSSRTAVPN